MPGQGGVPALSAFSTVWDGGRITERGDVTLWYVEALKEGMPPAIRNKGSIDVPRHPQIMILLAKKEDVPSSRRSMTESRSISVVLSPMEKASKYRKSAAKYALDGRPG